MVVWYIVFGAIGGVIAGMGMGGGTLLIPLLVIFTDLSQNLAQGINLISFIPASIVSLIINKKQGLIKGEDIGYIVVPAIISAVGGAILANLLESEILTIFFGIFLLVLGVIFLQNILKKSSKS